MKRVRVLIHASELLTGAGVREKQGRKVREEDLGRIEDGAIVYTEHKVKGAWVPGRIEWVGKTAELPKKYRRVRSVNLKNRQAVVPGFVDCHNHLVFDGNRAGEFAERCGGVSYEEIAARGGGILTTVKATRAASEEKLLKLGRERIRELYSYGVRTLEIKSGYGLSHESELKLLRVAQKLRSEHPEIAIHITFLGAHGFPHDQTREAYLQELLERTLPEVAAKKLADSCDVFIDRGYYTLVEGEQILLKAKELGLAVRAHADELANTESASMAARLGALSADHLLQVSEAGLRALAQSETVAVLLPGTAFYLKAAHAPARKLIDSGAVVALSTDFNPGTCVTLSLPTIMTIAALYLGMTRAEIFAAVTYNAAKALGMDSDRGTLEAGKDAALAVLPFERFEETYYRFAWSGFSGKTRR
jgi:imidazolonepropionase